MRSSVVQQICIESSLINLNNYNFSPDGFSELGVIAKRYTDNFGRHSGHTAGEK